MSVLFTLEIELFFIKTQKRIANGKGQWPYFTFSLTEYFFFDKALTLFLGQRVLRQLFAFLSFWCVQGF